MSDTHSTSSHKGGIITAIGVSALLIGTATDDAAVMLIITVIALAVMSIIFRQRIGQKALLALVVAVSIGIAVSMGVAKL